MGKRSRGRPRPRPGRGGFRRAAWRECRADRTGSGGRSSGSLRARASACVAEMEPDYDEGLELWKAGDPEEARAPSDTRFRLALQTSGCTSRWADRTRGVQGSGPRAWPFWLRRRAARKVLPASFSGRLPRERLANAPFYDAVEGLIRCFRAQAMPREAESLTSLARRLDHP